MVTNDLGACEWFVWDLRRSGLIDRGQLDQIVNDFLKRNPRAEAPALAEHLVGQNTLTRFQAERILNGKTQGLVLGPYVLLDAIGQGSMGQVYKATSKNDAGFYAIKVLPRRSMWNVRLARRQVRSFGQFSHNAVVPFVDVGTAGGLHYLVWPLAEGQTLETMVQQNGRLSPAQTASIAAQVGQGLNICHQNSIFHGLVKPSNVMVSGDGQARILDFGIGSLLVENEGESLVDTMSTANTLTSGLDCASPESIMEPTNRTPAGDQYSLGCVMYYCLTGRPPFPEGSAVEKMMAHQTKDPVAIREFTPDCPEALAEVVAKLMAKAPESRYADMDQVVEALEPFLGEVVAAGAPAGNSARNGSGSRQSLQGIGGPNNGRNNGNQFAPAARTNSDYPTAPTRSSVSSPATATPAPAARFSTPTPQPVSARAVTRQAPPSRPLPTRASTGLGGGLSANEEIELLQATEVAAGYSDPAALRASAGWVADAAAEDDLRHRKGNGIGSIVIAASALVLTALVFIGAKLLMK